MSIEYLIEVLRDIKFSLYEWRGIIEIEEAKIEIDKLIEKINEEGIK